MRNRQADINKAVQSHCVGFLAIDRSGRSELVSHSAGSGTLVDFRGIRGIATAAHVADVIKTLPEVGLMLFKPGLSYEAITCKGSDLEVTKIGVEPYGIDGPDLAFVRLPHDIEDRIGASHAYFNSLVRARAMVVGAERPPPELYFVTGIVSELSRPLGRKGNSAQTEHAAINGVGDIEGVELGSDGFDRIDFRILHHTGFPAPTSYRGLSGGGLWMLGSGNDELSRTLIGIAYFETNKARDGVRGIRCHGPLSLHETLYLAVLDRYAPEFAAEHRATEWPTETEGQ